jgi:AcrR family transcriptional regulator
MTGPNEVARVGVARPDDGNGQSAWEAKRGARSARGERTREALLEAARKLLDDTTYDELRVADVAHAAGTSLGTFYKYFPSKEAMFEELVHHLRDEILGRGDREAHAPGEPVFKRVESANRRFLRAFRRHANIMVVLDYFPQPPLSELGAEFRGEFVGRVEARIQRWQDEGLVARDIDAHYAAHALGGMVSRFAFLWFVLGEPFEERDAVRQLSLLWANALRLDTTSAD